MLLRFSKYPLLSVKYFLRSVSSVENIKKVETNFEKDILNNERKRKKKVDFKESFRRKREDEINFVRLKEDTFGDLTESRIYQKLPSEFLEEDEDHYDTLESKPLELMNKPRHIEAYTRDLQNLVHKRSNSKRIQEAIDLFNYMKHEARVPIQKYHYTLVMTGCAHVGFTKYAFKLFNELLEYYRIPSFAMVTTLFNACAECPFPEYGLEKANYLRDYLSEVGFILNISNYNSMIKAYGKLGQFDKALELFNELKQNKLNPNSETFAMLLMGCISDKNSGSYFAIETVKKMKQFGLQMTIYIYNLLLRALRDCEFGSYENIVSLMKETRNKNWSKPRVNAASTFDSRKKEAVKKTNFELSKADPFLPNLINEENCENIEVKPEMLLSAENRLMLIGGLAGFLRMMEVDKIQPNKLTFGLLIDLIPNNMESVDELLLEIKRCKIRPDIDFFNQLLKKLVFKKTVLEAKKVLPLLREYNLEPDIVTFGVLALGCTTSKSAKKLLADIENSGFVLNIEIVGALVMNATRKFNFSLILHLIEIMKSKQIKPQAQTIERIEMAIKEGQRRIVEYTKDPLNEGHGYYLNENTRQVFAELKKVFYDWLSNTTLGPEDHPWKQFEPSVYYPGKTLFRKFEQEMKEKISKKKFDFKVENLF